jgi:hypothetical protein
LIARRIFGARCTSSMTARSKSRMNATGSLWAAASVAGSSSVTYERPSRAKRRASVVFPDCRGPVIATTRVSRSASRIRV